MTTYRITTNGTRFRVEMFYSWNAYREWTPCEEFATYPEAKVYRDKCVRPRAEWVPVDREEVTAA